MCFFLSFFPYGEPSISAPFSGIIRVCTTLAHFKERDLLASQPASLPCCLPLRLGYAFTSCVGSRCAPVTASASVSAACALGAPPSEQPPPLPLLATTISTVATLVHLTGIGNANSHTWCANARHSHFYHFLSCFTHTDRYVCLCKGKYVEGTHMRRGMCVGKHTHCQITCNDRQHEASYEQNAGTQPSTLRRFRRCHIGVCFSVFLCERTHTSFYFIRLSSTPVNCTDYRGSWIYRS